MMMRIVDIWINECWTYHEEARQCEEFIAS